MNDVFSRPVGRAAQRDAGQSPAPFAPVGAYLLASSIGWILAAFAGEDDD